MAVAGFKHKGLEELFVNGKTKRIGSNHHTKIIELLDVLDAATNTSDLTGVSDFHPLKGDRKGEYSMHVNGNYCLTFKFVDGDVTEVNYEDYHRK